MLITIIPITFVNFLLTVYKMFKINMAVFNQYLKVLNMDIPLPNSNT